MTSNMDFMPLGLGSQRGILALDPKGRVSHCDAACQSFSVMPALHAPKIQPISLPIGDSLYVMDVNPRPGNRHCFEALIHGCGPKSCYPIDWYWHSLAPPPHVRAPNYVPYDSDFSDDEYEGEDDKDFNNIGMVHGPEVDVHMMAAAPVIDGHPVVGDSQIWISTIGAGTYNFETASGVWSQAMDWSLPFRGRAEYVPELNLWFGFSSQDKCLCAFDLTATASAMSPPLLRHQWDGIAQQEEWAPVISYIVPLGSGKLFIAEFFETKEKVDIKGGGWVYGNCDNFAVFTGVEFLEKLGGGLHMALQENQALPCSISLP
ncbi:hypothetical protein QYE76_001971 [Lolium multiflorum]|uniref:Uncharacterized protein n=1 Tax=Lolium multiflorum TaxID=4521 RepID=A0AAD8RPS4_LOLMU|nr:hypothetical protein QYE76_001971 [Lolium multiflorum]